MWGGKLPVRGAGGRGRMMIAIFLAMDLLPIAQKTQSWVWEKRGIIVLRCQFLCML